MNYFDTRWYGNGREQREKQPCRGMYMKAEEIDQERRMSGWNQYPGEEETDIQPMDRGEDRGNMRENRERRMEQDDRIMNGRNQNMWGKRMGDRRRADDSREESRSMIPGGQPMPGTQPMPETGPMWGAQPMPEGGPMWGTQPMPETGPMWGTQPMPETGPMWGTQPMPETRPMPETQPMPGMRPMPPLVYETPDAAQILRDQQMIEQDMRRLQSMFPESARILLPYIEEECDKMEYEGSAMFDERPDQETVRRISESIYGQVRDQFPAQEERQAEEILSMECRNCGRPGRNWPQDLIRVLLLQEMHQRRCRHGACGRRRRW